MRQIVYIENIQRGILYIYLNVQLNRKLSVDVFPALQSSDWPSHPAQQFLDSISFVM